jgi:outer membrane protein assembly factor BamB
MIAKIHLTLWSSRLSCHSYCAQRWKFEFAFGKPVLHTLEFLALLAISIFIIPKSTFAQVTEEWVALYTTADTHDLRASALEVDASGHVYVAGYIGGTTLNSFATIKYDANGNELWATRYSFPDAPDSSGSFPALKLDGAGNVFVTGYYAGSSGSSGAIENVTIKYDRNGNEIWAARHNGPGNPQLLGSAIAVDDSGNVYVTGNGYVTIKYDAGGNQLWTTRYTAAGDSFYLASALAVDAAGNLYVIGSNSTWNTSGDYTTIKYDATGNELWTARYNGPDPSWDQVSALALDFQGNVYVTGYSGRGLYGLGSYDTIKYDANGIELWTVRLVVPINPGYWHYYSPALPGIAVDTAGNVFVSGFYLFSMSYAQYPYWEGAVVKYDTNGNELWVARSTDFRYNPSIAVDAESNVYLCASALDSSKFFGFAAIKLDTDGNELWAYTYEGQENSQNQASAITIDSRGSIFVTGSGSQGADRYYATIKLVQATTENGGDSGGGNRGGCFISVISK